MLLDEIGTYLAAQGVATTGSTSNWRIGKGFEPDRPDKCITLFETGGDPNDMHQSGLIDRPTFQVRVRADNYGYSTARVKIEAARTALQAIGGSTLSGRRYINCLAIGEPLSLGYDEQQRPRLVMNFRALRSRTS